MERNNESWAGFKGELWKKEINVRDFIQNNYTPYTGDDSFLKPSSEKTRKVWNKLTEMFKVEREKGVYDTETKLPQSITTYGPGYIDKDNEVVVGLQTDAPLKRGIFPKAFSFGQFKIVSNLLNRSDVDTIYVCTDSGREGEYIYRLVEQMAGVKGKDRRRVWIDSQTEEEILRGIHEAKDLSEYDNLSESAYLRAKEDYLMGINFSRLLTLKYGNTLAGFLNQKYTVISVGRVMTCVLGMVVRREREIREFVKTPFYRVLNSMEFEGLTIEGEWRAVPGSKYFGTPKLYKENGFREKKDAQELINWMKSLEPQEAAVMSVERKQEKKNPPLLYNLAELQNDCSKLFKISPDETLRVVQELYEKKMVTYPRTDARVLSSAVAKEISKNISGLKGINMVRPFAEEILEKESYKQIAKTRYVNDKMITDHYAIIPTGQGLGAMRGLNPVSLKVYETIVRRFLAIFYEPAIYKKVSLTMGMETERFFASFKVLADPGYLKVMEYSFRKKKTEDATSQNDADSNEKSGDAHLLEQIAKIKKGMTLPVNGYAIKEGETSPPKRYNSGSMILAMENAGQLIEDGMPTYG